MSRAFENVHVRSTVGTTGFEQGIRMARFLSGAVRFRIDGGPCNDSGP